MWTRPPILASPILVGFYLGRSEREALHAHATGARTVPTSKIDPNIARSRRRDAVFAVIVAVWGADSCL